MHYTNLLFLVVIGKYFFQAHQELPTDSLGDSYGWINLAWLQVLVYLSLLDRFVI